MYSSSKLYHIEVKQDPMLTLGDEFNYKVQYNFTTIVFLGLQTKQVKNLSDVVKSASSLQGYLMHRTVTYREKISHLYVRYNTSSEAVAARDIFRKQEGFHAEVVDDILRCLYGYEVNSKRPPCPTIGFLDTVGEVRYSDPLSEVNAKNLLMKFGQPLVLGVQDGHVKVSFSSMAEGIGACIVYGQWFFKLTPQDPRFYYKVQLDKSEHFSELVNYSNLTRCDSEAFNLEYFCPKSDATDSLHFSYENTSHSKNYFPTSVTRYSRQYSRGRGGYKQKVG